jgi:hypothetical protein
MALIGPREQYAAAGELLLTTNHRTSRQIYSASPVMLLAAVSIISSAANRLHRTHSSHSKQGTKKLATCDACDNCYNNITKSLTSHAPGSKGSAEPGMTGCQMDRCTCRRATATAAAAAAASRLVKSATHSVNGTSLGSAGQATSAYCTLSPEAELPGNSNPCCMLCCNPCRMLCCKA